MVKKFLAVDFVRFCIVGALGFVINFSILTVLYRVWGWPLFFSQLLAGEVALFNNFYLHHNWTYKGRETMKTIKALLVQFHLTSWFAVLLTSVIVAAGVKFLNLHYVVALVAAAVVALAWNFVWSKYVIWHEAGQ